MNNKKDPMEQIILEDILKEAEAIDEDVLKNGIVPMSDDLKEKIKKNIYAQVEEIEKERLYAQLSEEDRKALELGREMLKKSDTPEEEKVVRYRKRSRVYQLVAAVAVLVLAMGITSIGGPERVIEMMKVAIEGREVVRVDSESEEENYIVTEEDEEAAYQKIRDVFGVDAVRPAQWPKGTVFVKADMDKEMQTVTLYYRYDNEFIVYYISSHFTTSSWGIDVENDLTDSYYVKLDTANVEVNEYEKAMSKEKTYSAKYGYEGLDYFLTGTMDKNDFEILIKTMHFF